MICPRCGFAGDAGAVECGRCGVVFAKLVAAVERPIALPRIESDAVEDGRISAKELKILGFGLAAAIVAYAIPFTRFVLSAIVTLFHELGHTVMGWLLGHASLPAFDLVYGGGLTHYGPFRPSIAIAVGAGFVWLGWLFRENPKSVAVIAAIFLVWLFIVTKEWRREVACAAAGHAAELILAGIFFYKSLAGVGWRNPELERPLGAFVAFFVQIHSMLFAWGLISDADALSRYREGKGGALMNDLEVIALDLQIWLGATAQIETVARWLLLFSAAPIGLALLWYLQRARCHRMLRVLTTADV